MKKNFIAIIGVGLLLAACATPYQSYGLSGGVGSQQLNDRLYKIDAKGNGYTSRGRVEDYTMLKASEICRERGFKSFSLVDSRNFNSQSFASTPATTSCYGASCTTYGGAPIIVNKPSASITVYFHMAGEEQPFSATNCDLIYNQLAPAYIAQ